MLKNTKNNSTKPTSGYDRVEFYIDFVHILLSAFMLGYVIGKKKRKKRKLKKLEKEERMTTFNIRERARSANR